ncbi:MAG: hypothetical protein IKN55_09355, partial [Oscillospiraceae bacterium]|nr:hypothetical protein [Oscillospiraceae bacterium]
MKKRMAFTLALALLLTGCGSAPMHVNDSELEELHSAALEDETKAGADSESAQADTTEEVTEEPTTEEPTEEPTTEEPTEPPTEEPTVPPLEAPDGAVNMQSGCLVVNSGTDHARAIELCGGNMNVGAHYAEVLNSFKGRLSGMTNVYCMVVPTSAAFYVPEDYQDKTCDQKAQYDNIVSNLNGVTGVPVYDAELMHRNEPTYSRT